MGRIPASRVRIPPSPLRAARPSAARRLLLRGKPCFPRIAPLFFAALSRLSFRLPPGEARLRRQPAAHHDREGLRLPCSIGRTAPRRGGRAVECGGLENRFGRFRPTRVQIPPPPPELAKTAQPGGLLTSIADSDGNYKRRGNPLEDAREWAALDRKWPALGLRRQPVSAGERLVHALFRLGLVTLATVRSPSRRPFTREAQPDAARWRATRLASFLPELSKF